MNWNHYQQEALTTAIYPLEREVDYTVLGLVSEIAELVEVKGDPALAWMVRVANYKKEAGDCFWYVAAVADALSEPLDELVVHVGEDSHWTDLPEIIDALVAKAGFLAGLSKKAIRDDEGLVTSARREQMLNTLSDILYQLHRLCQALSSTPEAITSANLNKLADRKSRGVLQGAGDNR